MEYIPYLICFPFVAACIIFLMTNDNVRKALATVFVVAIWALTGFVAFDFISNGSRTGLLFVNTHTVDMVMMGAEVFLMLLVCTLCIKYKKYPVMLLSIIPTAMCIYTEICCEGIKHTAHIRADRFSVLMCLIIGVIGGLIVIYSINYMKGYHEHHTEVRKRVNYFTALLFVFLGAMFGLVLSANLIWIFLFWEITSVCSFLLIGYTKTEEAVNNSFRALWMNLLGGFGFAVAIVMVAFTYKNLDLIEMVAVSDKKVLVPVMLLSFAALTKSAQLPFSSWLLGAMVAPTPSSALLHSATMVKAGCYLLLRLSPALCGNAAGFGVSAVGAFTFLIASMLAITVSDGKKVLAYSTISNLGLIVTCAGVGTKATVWAAMFLIIFHAVTKSMLFQCVGAIENSTHSRDVEDMSGLVVRYRKLAFIMIVGIVAMYLAPFGMLIFKWAALKAFVDASAYNVILVIILAFGSSTTLLYWTKWLCRIVSSGSSAKKEEDKTSTGQYFSMFVHVILAIGLCALFNIISETFIVKYIIEVFGGDVSFLSEGNIIIMAVLVGAIIIVPAIIYFMTKDVVMNIVPSYVAGVNRQDGEYFVNSYGTETKVEISNWYMEDIFGEKVLSKTCTVISSVLVIVSIVASIGGAFIW